MTDWLQTGSRASGQDWINGLYQQQDRQRAGRQLAGGDTRGAASTLYRGGDLAGGQALTAQATEADSAREAEQLQFTLQAAQALQGVRAQGGDVLAAYDSYAPVFAQMGVDQVQVQQFRQTLAQNPDAFLTGVQNIVGQRARELNIVNLGEGYAVAVDEATGQEVQRYERPRVPQRVAVGNDYIEVGPDGTVRPLYQGAREPEYQRLTDETGAETIVALGGRPGRVVGESAAAGGGAGGSVDVFAVLSDVIPGVTYQSGERTPEQNRAAGGVPTSFHLRGRAVDIPPQPGRSPAQLRAELEARGVQVEELIDEGDHWHIAWGNEQRAPNFGRGETLAGGAGGARVVARGGARPGVRDMTPAEVEQRGLPAGTVAQIRPDGSINVVSRGGDERFTEAQRRSAAFAARTANATATLEELAREGITRPSAQVLLGDGTIQRNARGANDRRILQAFEEWLAPILRKDTGAAVTDGEFARYASIYLPLPTDPPELVAQKARSRAVAERALRQEAGNAYSPAAAPSSTPRLRFEPSPQQRQWYDQYGNPQARAAAGSRQNPRIINPQDPTGSYANVPRGAYFLTPDGQLRGPKP